MGLVGEYRPDSGQDNKVLQRTPAAESGRGREGERKALKRVFSRWQQPEPETKNP